MNYFFFIRKNLNFYMPWIIKVFFNINFIIIKIFFCFIFWTNIFKKLFQTTTRGGTKTLQAQKETPEMNVSERDLIPVKISASNSKNSRSYSIFWHG